MNPALLIAPFAISGLSAALAALISLTDKIVNNYGECLISINDGKKELTVQGGNSMLATLAEQQIFIPSACGGRGSCGECKVKCTTDVGPHVPTEMPWMTESDLKNNVHLSCQFKVKGDVGIEIPEYLFYVKRYKATVERITDLTHDIKEVYLKLPDGVSTNYKAGQYAQIEVPPYGKIKETTQRAYSLSSTPTDANHVEFMIRLVPGGIVTTYVHEHLKEGQKLDVIVPFGEFHVRDTDATMVCVAGGSGMAPFKSIFTTMIEDGSIETRDVWYFFGARSVRDLFYVEWLSELDKKYEHFHFVPALSEPEESDNWEGETGLITEVLDKYILSDELKNAKKEGYLCGSPGMLDACMAVMRKHDMKEEDIYYDKFA